MIIGRKIYYDILGNVIWDKGEMEKNVRETTLEEDKLANPSIDIEGVNFIQLQYGERSDEFANMGSMKIIDGKLVIYPRLAITVDKSSIAANGTDTATITASGVGTELVTFSVNEVDQLPAISPVNGVATFQFATNVVGSFTITAKSALYGQNSVAVQGV